ADDALLGARENFRRGGSWRRDGARRRGSAHARIEIRVDVIGDEQGAKLLGHRRAVARTRTTIVRQHPANELLDHLWYVGDPIAKPRRRLQRDASEHGEHFTVAECTRSGQTPKD